MADINTASYDRAARSYMTKKGIVAVLFTIIAIVSIFIFGTRLGQIFEAEKIYYKPGQEVPTEEFLFRFGGLQLIAIELSVLFGLFIIYMFYSWACDHLIMKIYTQAKIEGVSASINKMATSMHENSEAIMSMAASINLIGMQHSLIPGTVRCPKCNALNPEAATTCERCGWTLEKEKMQ